jgi:3-hydroxyisobutyrate dehydrogenase
LLAAELSIEYVDAPVSGGVAMAKTGGLTVRTGGDPASVARSLKHLQPLATKIVEVGPSGSGHAAKALNNLLSATNVASVAEVLSVASKVGIDPRVMVSVINGSTGRSQASEVKYPNHVLTGTYDSGFSMNMMLKDLNIALGLIEAEHATAPIITTAHHVATAAAEMLGGEDLDHTEVARYYELQNNVNFTTDAL